jgi:hypothetical protein
MEASIKENLKMVKSMVMEKLLIQILVNGTKENGI